MKNADILKEIDKVGKDFSWQIGKVPNDYANGYLQAVRDCRKPFYKKEEQKNMSDLISKSELLKKMKWQCRGYCKKCEYSTFLANDEHCGLIDEQPTVEAKQAVNGEWVNDWNCSECNCSYMDYADGDSYRNYSYPLPNFCPNCGADMRKQEK